MLKENLLNFQGTVKSVLCTDPFLTYFMHSLITLEATISGESLDDFDIEDFTLTFRTIEGEQISLTKSFFAFEQAVLSLKSTAQLNTEQVVNLQRLLVQLKTLYPKLIEELEGEMLWVYERNFFNPFQKTEKMTIAFPPDDSVRTNLVLLSTTKNESPLFSLARQKVNPKEKWTTKLHEELLKHKSDWEEGSLVNLLGISIENVTRHKKYDENVKEIETITVEIHYNNETFTLSYHRSCDFTVPFEADSECFTESKFYRMYHYYTNGTSLGYVFNLESTGDETLLQDILKELFVDAERIEEEFQWFLHQEEKAKANEMIGLTIKETYEKNGEIIYVLENGIEFKKAKR